MSDEVKAAIDSAAVMREGSLRLWLAAKWLRQLANEDAVVKMMARTAFEFSPVHGRHRGRWDKKLPQDENVKKEWIEEQRAALLALAKECEK